MRILFIGDIVGGPGRRGLATALPRLRERLAPDLVIANGENAAGGVGITERTAADIHAAGADVITTGNHVYRQREAYSYLDTDERIVRPANYPKGNPGRGSLITEYIPSILIWAQASSRVSRIAPSATVSSFSMKPAGRVQ